MNLIPLPALNGRSATNIDKGTRSILRHHRHGMAAARPSGRRGSDHRTDSWKLRLGHVHLKVRDLNRSVPFYTRVLGLRLSEWTGRYAFLASGTEHHSIALEEVGSSAVNPSRGAVGVAHVAFEAPGEKAFSAMRKRLSHAGRPFMSRNNGTSLTIRFKDPDANEIEVFVDRRHSPGGTKLWGGGWYRPLRYEGTITEDEPSRASEESY